MKPTRAAGMLVAAATFLAGTPTVVAAVECEADVRATAGTDQRTDESLVKVWAVEIDARAECAKVYVDLTVTERRPDGEEVTTTTHTWRKVTTHSTYTATHRIPRDSDLTAWAFEVARCVVCGTE